MKICGDPAHPWGNPCALEIHHPGYCEPEEYRRAPPYEDGVTPAQVGMPGTWCFEERPSYGLVHRFLAAFGEARLDEAIVRRAGLEFRVPIYGAPSIGWIVWGSLSLRSGDSIAWPDVLYYATAPHEVTRRVPG